MCLPISVKAGYIEVFGLDLGSLARIYDDIVDMGAYEYHPNTIYPNVVHEIVIGTYPNVTTVPGAGIHYIESQKDFTMTLTPVEGYSLKYIQVKTDSKIRDEQGGIRITHNEDGTVTLVFPKVTEPLNIQLSGVSPVSNISINHDYTIRAEELRPRSGSCGARGSEAGEELRRGRGATSALRRGRRQEVPPSARLRTVCARRGAQVETGKPRRQQRLVA